MITGTGEVTNWIIRASSRSTWHPFHKEILTFIHRVKFQDFWKCSMRRDQSSCYWKRVHNLCVLTARYRAKVVCIEQLTFIFKSWLQLTANQMWVIQEHNEICILSFFTGFSNGLSSFHHEATLLFFSLRSWIWCSEILCDKQPA